MAARTPRTCPIGAWSGWASSRVDEAFVRRLQIQEKLAVQIADNFDRVLKPWGVAVVIEARHDCIASCGVRKPDAMSVTSRKTGAFRTDPSTRREFLAKIRGG